MVELPEQPTLLLKELQDAVESQNRVMAEELVARHPHEIYTWAALATLKGSNIAQYSAARVGYHRGLDTLRANGWRGSGYVKASHLPNRGFLTCLALLGHYAGKIGETNEVERCQEFLKQLDPSFNWSDFEYDNPIDFLFPR